MPSQFRSTVVVTVIVLLLLLCIALVVSCGDDTEPFPNYRQELCEVESDADGVAQRVIFDDGTSRTVSNEVTGFGRDSLSRMLAIFVEDTANPGTAVLLANVTFVFSPFAKKSGTTMPKNDPVEVLAAWISPRYINLRLSFMRGGEQNHSMGFLDEGNATCTRWDADGNSSIYYIKTIRLQHDQHGDGAYYKQEMFASCPLYPFMDQLQAGRDSVRIIVPQTNGEFVETFGI